MSAATASRARSRLWGDALIPSCVPRRRGVAALGVSLQGSADGRTYCLVSRGRFVTSERALADKQHLVVVLVTREHLK